MCNGYSWGWNVWMDEKHYNSKLRYDTSYYDIIIRKNPIVDNGQNNNWYNTTKRMDIDCSTLWEFLNAVRTWRCLFWFGPISHIFHDSFNGTVAIIWRILYPGTSGDPGISASPLHGGSTKKYCTNTIEQGVCYYIAVRSVTLSYSDGQYLDYY